MSGWWVWTMIIFHTQRLTEVPSHKLHDGVRRGDGCSGRTGCVWSLQPSPAAGERPSDCAPDWGAAGWASRTRAKRIITQSFDFVSESPGMDALDLLSRCHHARAAQGAALRLRPSAPPIVSHPGLATFKSPKVRIFLGNVRLVWKCNSSPLHQKAVNPLESCESLWTRGVRFTPGISPTNCNRHPGLATF